MFIVDTNVISFFIRNKPPKALYRKELESTAPLYLSVQTIAEIMAGAEQNNWGDRKKAALQNYFDDTFAVLSIGPETVKFYVKILTGSARHGKTLSVSDTWIMATALQHGLVLVTHDQDMKIGSELGIQIVCRA